MLMFEYENDGPSKTELTAAALIADLSLIDWNTLRSMENYVFDDEDADFLLRGTDADLEALNEIIEHPALLESLSGGLLIDYEGQQQLQPHHHHHQQQHQHEQHLFYHQHPQQLQLEHQQLATITAANFITSDQEIAGTSFNQTSANRGQRSLTTSLRKRPMSHEHIYPQASEYHPHNSSFSCSSPATNLDQVPSSSSSSSSSSFLQHGDVKRVASLQLGSSSKSLQSFHSPEKSPSSSEAAKNKPVLEELWDYFSYCQTQVSSQTTSKNERRSSHHVLGVEKSGHSTAIQYRSHGSLLDTRRLKTGDEPPQKMFKLRQSSLEERFVSPPEFSAVADHETSDIKCTNEGGYIGSIHSPKSSPATPGANMQCSSDSIQSPLFSSSISKLPAKESLQCSVCGDNAICLHYGVRTCEGCKGFFKRTVQKGAKYSCPADKKCPVDKRRRNRCQFCRFQKCLAVGMQREVVRMNSLKGRRGRLPSRGHLTQMGSFDLPPINIASELVKAYVERSAESNQLLDDESSNVDASVPDIIKQFYAMFVQTFETYQNWSVRIPNFVDLLTEDRNLLFNSSFLELFSFQIAKNITNYDTAIILGNGVSMSLSRFPDSFKSWIDSLYQLSDALKRLCLDTTSTACMEALLLLSDRYGLMEPERVENLQNKILESLSEHISNTYEEASINSPVMSHILGKLPQLRNLCLEGLQLLRQLESLENKVPVPSLIKCIFLSENFVI